LIKYYVHSGRIKSISDNNIHVVYARDLLSLYGVKREECYLGSGLGFSSEEYGNLIHLYPLEDGNYRAKSIELGTIKIFLNGSCVY
jgi:hypothetical protein